MVDVKTFMLVLAIGNISFAMLLAGYARGGRDLSALRLWKCAKLIQGMAHTLGWLRPDLHSPWADALANILLVSGIACEVGAYASFLRVPRWPRVLVPGTVLALVGFLGGRVAGAGAPALAALMSLIIAAFTAAMAAMLLRRQGRGSLLQRMIGVNDAFFALVMAARAWEALHDGGAGVFAPGLVQSLTYLTGYALLIVNGFGFLLLCKQQDDARLRELATRDSLTGLMNRRAFIERTAAERQRAARLGQPVALLMLDIDHFKHINDRFGHALGDEALCLFARTAQAGLRAHDLMARLGGEEFAVLMPESALADALQAAERVRAAVAQASLAVDGEGFSLTVSIGVVVVDGAEHINAALARADHALYAAKHGGRNRVQCGEAAPAAPRRA